MSKKAFLSVFISIFIVTFGFAASSAPQANRRTATRYLQLAEQYVGERAWKEAASSIELGLAYDDAIPDLWYLKAVVQKEMRAQTVDVIPLLEKAMSSGTWIHANNDAARLMYAGLLCETLRYDEAIKVLDKRPLIYSSDAEYIRIMSYYAQNTKSSIKKARDKVNIARKIYPMDSRFARLFFSFEYKLKDPVFESVFNPQTVDKTENAASPVFEDRNAVELKNLSYKFIEAVDFYKNPDDELILYAAIFSEGEEKVRRLKKFAAEERKAPLFAAAALKAGTIKETAAIDAFYKFADNEIDLSVIEEFVSVVQDEKSKSELYDYFNSYNGIVDIDIDGNLAPNLVVKYKSGRAESIVYDKNHDGALEWTCECDFGAPTNLHMAKDSLDITYAVWPDVQLAVYHLDSETSNLVFNIVAENLAYSPFAIDYDEVLKAALDVDFYIPKVIDGEYLRHDALINAASSYELPSKERPGAVVRVSLLNGTVQEARYYVGDTNYAIARFENGIPTQRSVDKDNDGFFETLETYGFTSEKGKKERFISEADERLVITNLFGQPAESDGLYLKSIQIDENRDMLFEFMEEYIEGLGKVTSWDNDGDGNWDVQYIRHPERKNGTVVEEAKFHQPLTSEVVTVTSENGKPLTVTKGSAKLAVSAGKLENLYWISEAGTETEEIQIVKNINQIGTQGVCIIIKPEDDRFLAVRIEDNIFVEKLPPSEISDESLLQKPSGK